MGKKCTICGKDAKYNIKDSSEYYCEECALESFDDISALVRVEEQAKRIKKLVEEHAAEETE
jgi:hypothetical protein